MAQCKGNVRDSIGDSIWDNVGRCVWSNIWDNVGRCVWDSVWSSIWDNVGRYVGGSRDSVEDSVGDSIWAYISSLYTSIKTWKYIDHPEGENPFRPAIDLWHRGFVPSFDGKIWRLHAGEKAEVVWEGEI